MFEPSEKARIYGLPPGVDFPAAVVSGVLSRMKDTPPEAVARVQILVNTRRMQRRIKALFADGSSRLLPRIGLITDVGHLLPPGGLPPSVPPLRRRLEMARLVKKLIDTAPDIAPRSAAVDLADSLSALLDEMQGEGVTLEDIQAIDTGDQSGHWDRSLRFVSLVRAYADQNSEGLDPEARQRFSVNALLQHWAGSPPAHPVIVAGSTGSRATTSLLMQGVAGLPQGAIILPGFDFDLPQEIWKELADNSGTQDHPQYRFAALLSALGMSPPDVADWSFDAPRTARNSLISLSLRPAPVTDQWLTAGPEIGDLRAATKGLALIEAPQPRDEAQAIAVALRQAIEAGRSTALITPDRTLGRRVAAALARWGIVPDDSSGRPLSLTAPGRFLRQVGGLIDGSPASHELISLLKHPLTHTGGDDRGPHLRLTREFELYLRKRASPEVTHAILALFRKTQPDTSGLWCDWLADVLVRAADPPTQTLSACLDRHIALSEFIAQGGDKGSGALWDKAAGRDAVALIDSFRSESAFDGNMPFAEYRQLLDRALSATNTRADTEPRTDVMIWGTLEARVQGAEFVILGGLNEGTWPERPAPDPWLNRKMREAAGMLLPERQIGLSAHDYQQAVAAQEVVLSRAKRDAEAETVPSRWLNRLTNFLGGLPHQNGPEALQAMRTAGDRYLAAALALDRPDQTDRPALRPAPAPPVHTRPRDFTVTEIKRLIRDPYAIYARHVLGLKALRPLDPIPDALLRGTVFHKILEEFCAPGADFTDASAARARFLEIGHRCLATFVPWPSVRAHWFGHLSAIADRLVADEQARRAQSHPIGIEVKGKFDIPGTTFSVRGKADRIDRTATGALLIFDYKTGAVPTPDQMRYFDRQLLIEAVMAEAGAFTDVPAGRVEHVVHIGLGRNPVVKGVALVEGKDTDFRTVTILGEFVRLLTSFDNPGQGYPSRRATKKERFEGDYDHLARFGEWDASIPSVVERLP
jgi:ATP-dependent helicase/nuclease subunit B